MNRLNILVIAIIATFMTACAAVTIRPENPTDQDKSVVGLSLNYGMFRSRPNVVTFVKLDDTNMNFITDRVIPSNYTSGNRYYLVNAPPGRYAAVAALSVAKSHQAKPTAKPVAVTLAMEMRNATYFSKDLIQLTEVSVKPGAIVFMGDYVVKQDLGMEAADDVQQHYRKLLGPEKEEKVIKKVLKLFIGKTAEFSYKGSLRESNRDKESEKTFFIKARKDFEGTAWSPLIDQALEK